MSGGALAGGLLALAILVWPAAPAPLARLRTELGPAEHARGRLGVPNVAAWVRGRWLGARTHGQIERDLVTVLEGISAALRAGLPPARALALVARTSTGTADVGRLVARLAAVAAQGAPLEPAWRRAADELASPAIAAVAEAWAMAERHGAPIVDVLDSLITALRDQRRATAAVETALAAPRATATLLGVLPVGGLLLGELVGVAPLPVLFGSTAGRVAGLAGLACTLGGRWWIRRLVARAESDRPTAS